MAPRRKLIQLVVAALLVFGLVRWAGAVDVLSAITKPVVVAIVRAVGIAAEDAGTHLVVGTLHVPWSRDCAGLNVLALLVMVSLWGAREERWQARHAWRLAAALPLAFVANVARILTLISYRGWAAPAVEPAAMHYFVGFAWVLPWVPWLAGGWRRLNWLDSLHAATALALVAVVAGAPGGTLACAATVVALVANRAAGAPTLWQLLVWVAVAAPIALARMESLWLAWVLACPLAGRWTSDASSARRAGLLLGAITPLTGMWPIALLAWVAGGWTVWSILRGARSSRQDGDVAPAPDASTWYARGWVTMWMLFPFVATVPAAQERGEPPPAGVMARTVEHQVREIAWPGLPAGLTVLWYEPQGDGRHHSLPVCMRYRGVTLEATAEPGVMTDGSRLYHEFFVVERAPVPDYRAYLWRTFVPGSPAGAHVIVTATAAEGAEEAKLFRAHCETVRSHLARLLAERRVAQR